MIGGLARDLTALCERLIEVEERALEEMVDAAAAATTTTRGDPEFDDDLPFFEFDELGESRGSHEPQR